MPNRATLRANNAFTWSSPDNKLVLAFGKHRVLFPQGTIQAGVYRIFDANGNDLLGRVRFRAGGRYHVLRGDDGTIQIQER